ncbi:MAG: alpha/beta hydrolase [Acidobacteriota bacterium]
MTGQVEFLDVHGVRTQVLRGGSGQPLLYLHTGGGETFWLPFHEALATHYSLIAPAHPGFDQSEGLNRIQDIEDLAFHYLDLLDALKLDRVNIVGASFGGWIAAELAVRWPERIRRLVLVDSVGIWLPDHPIAELFGLEPADWRNLIFHDPNSEIAQALVQDDPPEEMLMLLLKAMEALARIGWNPYLHNPKLHGRLHRINIPTLILWGENDQLVPPIYGEAFRDAIANSELVLIKNCGHLPIFEQTEKFVEQVVNFLGH